MTQPLPRRKDLGLAVVLVLGGLLLSLLPLPGAVKTAVMLPAVLLAPGYAIGAALFRPGEIPREYRIVLSVALSVAAFVLGGLLVQLVLPLNRAVLALMLSLVTIGASLVAYDRRRTAPVNRSKPLDLAGINPLAALAMLAAIGVAAWAIGIATEGAHDQLDRSHFTSLWVVPPGTGASPVKFGVSNEEGAAAAYRLQVNQGGKVLARWRFRLGPNHQWQSALAAASSSAHGPLVGRLYRNGALDQSVTFQTGGTS